MTMTARTIITESDSAAHGVHVGVDPVPAVGTVHYVPTTDEAEAEADAALRDLKRLIRPLEAAIGFRAMDELLSAVNHVEAALREEALARLITAAVATHDWQIGVFVPPEDAACRRSDP